MLEGKSSFLFQLGKPDRCPCIPIMGHNSQNGKVWLPEGRNQERVIGIVK